MRAREPDADGLVHLDGVKLHWEVFGDGEPTLLLLPTWTVIHSRFWKAQVPYLAPLPIREFAESLAAGGRP